MTHLRRSVHAHGERGHGYARYMRNVTEDHHRGYAVCLCGWESSMCRSVESSLLRKQLARRLHEHLVDVSEGRYT